MECTCRCPYSRQRYRRPCQPGAHHHDGRVVAEASEDGVNDAVLQLAVANPRLWSPESPYLYTLTLSRLVGGKKVDEESHNVGIRPLSFG